MGFSSAEKARLDRARVGICESVAYGFLGFLTLPNNDPFPGTERPFTLSGAFPGVTDGFIGLIEAFDVLAATDVPGDLGPLAGYELHIRSRGVDVWAPASIQTAAGAVGAATTVAATTIQLAARAGGRVAIRVPFDSAGASIGVVNRSGGNGPAVGPLLVARFFGVFVLK